MLYIVQINNKNTFIPQLYNKLLNYQPSFSSKQYRIQNNRVNYKIKLYLIYLLINSVELL